MDDILIVIPSFNEFLSLKKILPKLEKKNLNYLVIDDGSTDETKQFLKKKYVDNYLSYKNNKGYEYAIYLGYKFAKNKNYSYLVTFDGDGQHNLNDLTTLFKIYKNYDLLVGERDKKNLLIENLINKYFYNKYNINDILCGLKMYNIKKIKFFKPLKKKNTAGMIFTIMAIKSKPKIKNIPIKINKRSFGVSKFGDTFFGNFNFLNYFINLLVQNNRI